MKKFTLIQACVLSASLSACGGGDGGTDVAKTVEYPEGVYTGYVTSDETNKTYEGVVGVVSENGEGHFVIPETGHQLVVQLEMSGNSFSGALRVYQPSNAITSTSALSLLSSIGTASGTVEPRKSITGSYSSDGFNGTFSFDYNKSVYEQASQLKQVTGMWSSESDGYSITVVIREDGTLYGSDSTGCAYEGPVTLQDVRFNDYDVAVSVTCSNAAFTAVGWVVRHPAQSATPGTMEDLENIEIGFSNETRAYYNRLTKVAGPQAPTLP
jgi:hypothetical protein